MKQKNLEAQSLGRLSWKSRSKGKTKRERSEMMKALNKKRWELDKVRKESGFV